MVNSILIALVIGTVGTTLFLIIMIVFWKLILTQVKIWVLASRGYKLIEHVGGDNIRRYFMARPVEDHFDFNEGFYNYVSETITRKGSLLQKVKPELLKKIQDTTDKKLSGEDSELLKLYAAIKDIKYDRNLETLSWGIPTLTYYADNPDPINYKDRKQTYGSGIIRDVYLKILLTRNYKWQKRMLQVLMICVIVAVVALAAHAFMQASIMQQMKICNIQNNVTQHQLLNWLNQTGRVTAIPVTNTTIV